MAIAQMQNELAQHLATQNTTIDALYQQAAIQTDNVREGNIQLVRAKESAKTSRLWFLFIVLVLSFSLWFLDMYAGDGPGAVLPMPPLEELTDAHMDLWLMSTNKIVY